MKTFLCTIAIILASAGAVLGQVKTVQVLDKQTREPLAHAHILSLSGDAITATDTEGFFTVNTQIHKTIIVHYLGFSEQQVELDSNVTEIYVQSSVIRLNTGLLVSGDRGDTNNIYAYQKSSSHQSIDSFLKNVDGVSMIQRGAFAWEPAIRGQSDQRMNLMIDGMQVFKACVDKMDPITSYVETGNLARLDIDKNGAGVAEHGNGNSTLNLITQKAQNTPFTMDIESAFRAPGLYQNYNINMNSGDKSKRNAFRFSGGYKKASDMRAGNGTTIENTQYEKLNLNADYQHTFPSGHRLGINYITDKAYDVGYPALLMDATRALADIGRLQFIFADQQRDFRFESASVYANTIRHTMDDYSRDVAAREVMRGMYMPMYGQTETYGGKLNGQVSISDYHINWFLDGFLSKASGDMKMESLNPDVADMLIYNLDDVRTSSIAMGFSHHVQLSSNLGLHLEENIRFNKLNTRSNSHASLFEGLYNRNLKPRARVLLSGSASLLWMLGDTWSITGSTVYSERMGNHMELFGHYIYNYTDGFFYDGNPWLKPERTIAADLNTTWETDHHSLSFTLFHKQFFNYIDGIVAEDVSNNDFRFKRYSNAGNAITSGAELRHIHNFADSFRVENRASYLYAQNLTLDEPLPLIPPLQGTAVLSYSPGNHLFSLHTDWASAQNRIAAISSIEDKTKGYITFGASYERSWLQDKLTTSLEIDNLTDQYYHTHTSLGNIPESGFSLMLSARYRIQ